ncbi:hypothetical protein BD560DRAFT_410336 [Blakeslea trispora]|nr:hypothetical protein BD560DRAFT_410336 [Blakeslea trispora]
MSDYWVSQQRHWCKYCKKFITNNKPSIALHENGRAHKDQVERFMRDVFKKGRQDQEDADNVRRELERIEKAALNSVGIADRAKHVSHTLPAKRTDYYYAPQPTIPTIEELRQGKKAEEKESPTLGRDEWAVKKEIAQVGEWETVAQPIMPPSPVQTREIQHEPTTHDQRPEFQDDDEQDDDLHSFKIREKELPVDDLADQTEVTFRKRKVANEENEGTLFKARKKKPLRKKE